MRNSHIEECRIAEHIVKVITINGFQMVGKIIEHDDESIIVLCGDVKKSLFSSMQFLQSNPQKIKITTLPGPLASPQHRMGVVHGVGRITRSL